MPRAGASWPRVQSADVALMSDPSTATRRHHGYVLLVTLNAMRLLRARNPDMDRQVEAPVAPADTCADDCCATNE
jgi:hypothetical protein